MAGTTEGIQQKVLEKSHKFDSIRTRQIHAVLGNTNWSSGVVIGEIVRVKNCRLFVVES